MKWENSSFKLSVAWYLQLSIQTNKGRHWILGEAVDSVQWTDRYKFIDQSDKKPCGGLLASARHQKEGIRWIIVKFSVNG